jgi:hypothetical protein
MTLAAGSKLGPYEIVAPLGAGGVGQVYRLSVAPPLCPLPDKSCELNRSLQHHPISLIRQYFA